VANEAPWELTLGAAIGGKELELVYTVGEEKIR
jgi:hypothetical protein